MQTPNGYDSRWVDAINNALAHRDSSTRLRDIDDYLWELFLGPLCDAVDRGYVEFGDAEHRVDLAVYAVRPALKIHDLERVEERRDQQKE